MALMKESGRSFLSASERPHKNGREMPARRLQYCAAELLGQPIGSHEGIKRAISPDKVRLPLWLESGAARKAAGLVPRDQQDASGLYPSGARNERTIRTDNDEGKKE